MRNNRFLFFVLACAWSLCCFGQSEVLTLDSCLASARRHNFTIRSAQLDVAIAREVKKQMLWKYFPQVSIEGFAFGALRHLVDADVTELGLDGGTSDFLKDAFDLLDALSKAADSTANISSQIRGLRWGVTAQAKAVQPIFWGGQIVTANKLAKLGIDVAQLKQEVSERDVLQEVTETYWLVAGLNQKRATVSKATELLDTIASVADNAYHHGLATANDILRVQLKQNEMHTKSLQLENGIRLASRLLCHLSGLDYAAPLVLEPFAEEDTLVAYSPELQIISIDGRPEASLLEKNLQYNKLMRRLTLGESLPHLAIGASGGYTNLFEKHNGNVIAFLNLSVPITGWGETSHKLKQHDWQIKQAEWLREDYRAKLDLQNRQIFDRLTESIQLLEEHRASRELARENHRIALMNYQAGVGTMTELMEAETLLLHAENALTDAHISYLTALRKFRDFNK